MTRRDYCAKCGDMVGDCDVRCYECGKSLHDTCATTCDNLSRICILEARLKCYVNPTMTRKELCQYYLDITDERFLNILNADVDLPPEYTQLNNDKTKQLLDELGLVPTDIGNVVDGDQNISKAHCEQVAGLLEELCLSDFDLFKCRMCHLGIKIKY